MTESVGALKRERLYLRLDFVAKRKLERAAAYQQQSLSEFVLMNAVRAADEIIQAHETVRLDDQDRDVFFDAILNPPKPNKALRETLKWYDESG